MESLSPCLNLLLSVKRSMECGNSIRHGILTYLNADRSDFSKDVSKWLSFVDQGGDVQVVIKKINSLHRRSLLELLQRGLKGESIHSSLLLLEREVFDACDDEIQRKLAKLPFILLFPLMALQFPAFLAILFGPLLENFFHSFGAG